MISDKDIEKVAKLSRLILSESEKQKLGGELSRILGYVEKLGGLNVTNVRATAHAVEVTNVFREDEVIVSQVKPDVLNQAPEFEAEFFRVPKII